MQLYDENGDPIEGALPPDEVQTLQEKAQKAEELQVALEEKEKLLSGYQDKELNLTRYRHKSEEEKKAIKDKMDKEKQMLLTEVEDLRNERETEKAVRMSEAKESILSSLAGKDPDLRKSIELQAQDFAGEALTPKELHDRYSKAFTLVSGRRPTINPLNGYYPTGSYTAPKLEEDKFVKTEQGKAAYKQLFGRDPLNS